MSKDYIPVSPAAHYSMGGIKTNIEGQTSVRGLFAIGEVASSGLHGANRLASNSLLECVVMADNLVKSLKNFDFTCSDIIDENILNTLRKYQDSYIEEKTNIYELKTRLKNIMWEYAGIIKSENSVKKAQKELEILEKEFGSKEICTNKEEYEFSNMLTIAKVIVKCALKRKESRGSHFREDFPTASEEEKHSYIRIGAEKNGEVFTS